MDFIISENQLQLILSEGVKYTDFTSDQLNDIERLGEKAFNKIKSFRDEGTGRDINYWLNKYGLTISIPSEDFLKKNLEDVNFVLDNIRVSRKKEDNLWEVKYTLEEQLSSRARKFIYLFHEVKENGDLEWSFVNMFDNNRKLWIRLMNKRYPDIKKEEIPDKIREYFSDGSAEHDLLSAMIHNRKEIFDEVFTETWGGGTEVENRFFKKVEPLVPAGNLKVFSGKGNFVDRSGIDAALKCGDYWMPIQVKSSQTEAIRSIPYGGISVFPAGENFYFFQSKENAAKMFTQDFFTNCE